MEGIGISMRYTPSQVIETVKPASRWWPESTTVTALGRSKSRAKGLMGSSRQSRGRKNHGPILSNTNAQTRLAMMRGQFGSLLAKCCGYNPEVYDGSNERFGFRNRKTASERMGFSVWLRCDLRTSKVQGER
jgi:hypothetical protein